MRGAEALNRSQSSISCAVARLQESLDVQLLVIEPAWAQAGRQQIGAAQPMLGIIQRAFPDSNAVGLIPTAMQLGFATGLFSCCPWATCWNGGCWS